MTRPSAEEEAQLLQQEITEIKEILAISALLPSRTDQKYAVLAYFAEKPRSLVRHPFIAQLLYGQLALFR